MPAANVAAVIGPSDDSAGRINSSNLLELGIAQHMAGNPQFLSLSNNAGGTRHRLIELLERSDSSGWIGSQ